MNHAILTRLRRLIPNRALNNDEALHVAEKQAHDLRRIVNHPDQPLLPDWALTSLPGIHVETVSGLDVSAATRRISGTWIVLLNHDDTRTRRRFSLAHEIKHILDDHAITKLYPKSGRFSRHHRTERICDYFAACLLMPRPLVKRLYTTGIQKPLDMAAAFEVSPQAMTIRLHQLGLTTPKRHRRHRTRFDWPWLTSG